MKTFELQHDIFSLNLESDKMVMLKKGMIFKPRRNVGNECWLSCDKTVFMVTIDVFREFFILKD